LTGRQERQNKSEGNRHTKVAQPILQQMATEGRMSYVVTSYNPYFVGCV
jgi:hypothetical protein